jgi:hypothetical protein
MGVDGIATFNDVEPMTEVLLLSLLAAVPRVSQEHPQLAGYPAACLFHCRRTAGCHGWAPWSRPMMIEIAIGSH